MIIALLGALSFNAGFTFAQTCSNQAGTSTSVSCSFAREQPSNITHLVCDVSI
jgi:hypothetical protein